MSRLALTRFEFIGMAVVCDTNSDGQARMCVSGATPMSEGRTYPEIYTDRLDGVVNNTTYDSGCAV
jgi:hypothetical protein